MPTLNWPGFGVKRITWSLDQPSQSNLSQWTGKRTVVTNPWFGRWSATVELAPIVLEPNALAVRSFLAKLKGGINTFHLPAAEGPQNANTGVTVTATAAAGATSMALSGVATPLKDGQLVTVNGQLLQLTANQSGSIINFAPRLRVAATAGTAVETAKPYALVYLTASNPGWSVDPGQVYAFSFDVEEAVAETDGADPVLDIWHGAGGGGGGGGGGPTFTFPELTSFTSRALLAAVPSPTDKKVAYLTEAGREGTFVFSTANLSANVTADTVQALYVAPSSDTSGASGAWVRKPDASLSVRQAGSKSDDSTDDQPAFLAVIADQKANAVTGHQYGNASFRASVPKGSPAYRLAGTIDVDISARFESEGTGYAPGIWATILHPDAGVTAIRVHTDTTTGESGTKASTPFTGSGALFVGFGVVGQYNGTTHLEVTTGGHGYHLRGTASLRDGGISDMQGDGVHIHAGVATPGFIGNANGWEITRFFIQNCTNGISTNYSDSNAGMASQVTISGCREWGIKNNAGAANLYLGCLAQICGVWGDGTTNKPAAACHKTGNHYAVRVGQEAWCSANPPSGGTSSNTGWIWFEAGGIANPGYVDWFNGMVCRAGGAWWFGTSALGISMYFEGSQPPPQISGNSILLGGTWGGTPIGGATIQANSNQLVVNSLNLFGALTLQDDVGADIALGRPAPGSASTIAATGLSTALQLGVPGQVLTYGTSTEFDVYPNSGHGWFFLSSGLFAPFTDNAQDAGSSGKRIANIWCANATIQTSDANHKSHVRDLAHADFDKLLDAVGAVPLVAYKMKDAVAEKGEDTARDHYGVIAQDLHDEMVKRGLDPFAGGVLGRDMVLEEFEEEVEIEQEATRTEYFEEPHVEIVDGKAIKRMVLVPREIADWIHIPVHDEDGNPVIIPARPPTKKKAIVDGELIDVDVPGSPERPETHKVRRMERVKVMMPRQRVKLDANGDEEFIWNVRYSEFFALHAAWQRREMSRLASA